MSQSQNHYVLQSNTICSTVCCPTVKDKPTSTAEKLLKKEKKYISLTINKHKQTIKSLPAQTPQPDFQSKPLSTSSLPISQEMFNQDKSSFLEQIRNYSPQPQYQNRQISFKSLDTTKQLQNSGKSTLSNLLQSMGNQIFSEMFVSSGVKGKVLLSGQLRSISEVRSEMEVSDPTQVFKSHILEQK